MNNIFNRGIKVLSYLQGFWSHWADQTSKWIFSCEVSCFFPIDTFYPDTHITSWSRGYLAHVVARIKKGPEAVHFKPFSLKIRFFRTNLRGRYMNNIFNRGIKVLSYLQGFWSHWADQTSKWIFSCEVSCFFPIDTFYPPPGVSVLISFFTRWPSFSSCVRPTASFIPTCDHDTRGCHDGCNH